MANHVNRLSIDNFCKLNIITDSFETNDEVSNAFCNQNNVDHCLAYICQELQALGFTPLISNGAKCDTFKLVNAIYGLLGLHRRGLKQREEYDERISRLLSDMEVQRTSQMRLKDKLDQTERTLQTTIEANRQTLLKLKALQSDFKAEKDETKRLQSIIQQRDAQYHHEKRRKEMEYSQMKERLHHAMNDKKIEKKLGFDITNTLQRPDGKRGRWNTTLVSSKNEEDMQKKIMAGYEVRNKTLLEENILLRETLFSVYKILPTFTIYQAGDIRTETVLPDKVSSYLSITDTTCALESVNHLTSPIFQMPYQQVAQKIHMAFDEKFKLVKKQLNVFDDTLEKEWSSRKQKYLEEISELKLKIDAMEETIETQNLFLKASINIEGSPIKDTKDIFEEKEKLRKLQRDFSEIKGNFEKERQIYTEAVLRLAREKRDFHKEKTEFYKQQLSFSDLSPQSPTDEQLNEILPPFKKLDLKQTPGTKSFESQDDEFFTPM